MKSTFRSTRHIASILGSLVLAISLSACNNMSTESGNTTMPANHSTASSSTTSTPSTPTPSTPTSATPANSNSGTRNVSATPSNLPTIRVKAGIDEPLKDSQGNTWAPDTGADGGSTIDRPDLQVTGTSIPEIYKSEHYSMDSYSFKVPNGNYTLKLHFSEDYDGISSPTDRVFTYTVKDGDAKSGKVVKEVKDFSPWKAAGAQYKAYVDTIPLTVTSGQISIAFTPQVENPQINAIEIVPR